MLNFIDSYIQNSYLRALAVLIIVFIFLRVTIFIIEKIILRLTLKTKTDLDDLIVQKSSKPLTFIMFLFGINIALKELPLTTTLLEDISKIVSSFIILAIAYLVYVVVDLVVIRAWKRFARKTKSDIDDSLVNLVHGIMKVILVIFSLLYLLDFWGIAITPFLAGIGIGGIAIAFALQSSLSNIFGGVSIIMDKSAKVGDLVYLDDGVTKGKIMSIGLRSTRIQTFDNEVVIVPNGVMANSKIQNIALPEPKVRVVIPFGVAYGSDIEKVKKVVLSEIKKVKNLISDPEPSVKFLEMGNSSLNFKAFFYVDSFENRFNAQDEANTRIYNALSKNKIEIPFPQMDVHIKK